MITTNSELIKETIFEFRSFIGKIVFGRKQPQKISNDRLLNFGSGNDIKKGWVCADFYDGILPWNRNRVKKIWMFDFRQGIPCVDNYWNGIFSEHVIEHFTYEQVEFIFNELYRTLKPGCRIRISVPCIEKSISGKYKGVKLAKSLHNLTQRYSHKSVWNFELLKKYLSQAKFRNIKQHGYKRGTKMLLIDNANRSFESIYIEALK